ncbi:hypothetical protein THF1D04_10719 [Vibrio owensii]|uniref:Uncharacterized protein n=1 Tax=Vibrio owensii TaxID=696485 RepID=A0AAU9PZG8_9VIBR|nr:hypothetical protein THF1D04_10719 [Vibrio owensii]
MITAIVYYIDSKFQADGLSIFIGTVMIDIEILDFALKLLTE